MNSSESYISITAGVRSAIQNTGESGAAFNAMAESFLKLRTVTTSRRINSEPWTAEVTSYSDSRFGLMRYPGGKGKLAEQICRRIADAQKQFGLLKFIDAFVGAGAITARVLKMNIPFSEIVINDKDYGMYCVWNSVLNCPELLISRVNPYQPTAADFFQFKRDLLSDSDHDAVVTTAFKKLTAHQLSYSGLGTMAGGPLGGREQNGATRVDDRWRPELTVKKIKQWNWLAARAGSVTVSCEDFESVIKAATRDTFVYADPPYWLKGNALYQMGMTESDHNRLRDTLQATEAKWLLSYDDHERIRDLYSWKGINITEISNSNTIVTSGGKANRKNELLISNY